jgi:hypothetical protein
VPGGSGGGIPGNAGCTGLAFWRLFWGRGLAKTSVEPPRAPDLAPKRERLRELNSDLRPRLRAPARLQHHAQNAVDAEPEVPEAGVGLRTCHRRVFPRPLGRHDVASLLNKSS